MTYLQPENSSLSFKCSQCGAMFSLTADREGECPTCGFHCSEKECKIVDASDEGY